MSEGMSEEEIIKKLEYFCNYEILYGGKICFTLGQLKGYQKAIEGLLDLYQKEKEKNRELSNLSENIKIFRDKNFSDETKYVIALNSNYMNYLKLDYISKDKIREKLNFYKRYGKIANTNEYVMSVEIEVLEELLEENNEM